MYPHLTYFCGGFGLNILPIYGFWQKYMKYIFTKNKTIALGKEQKPYAKKINLELKTGWSGMDVYIKQCQNSEKRKLPIDR